MPESYTYHIACSSLAASGAVSSAISSVTAGICKVKMLSKGWTRVAMVAAGGLSGSVASSMADGDFLDGVCNGLISSGLNHAMHLVADISISKYQANKYVEAARAFLIDMGYDEEQVNQDVTVQKDGFFGNYYAHMDETVFNERYIDAFNSGVYDSYSGNYSAYESKSLHLFSYKDSFGINHTNSFSLKYYPDRANSIGIVRTGFYHYYEAGMEMIDGKVRNWTGKDNVIYNMHEKNANDYLYFRKR